MRIFVGTLMLLALQHASAVGLHEYESASCGVYTTLEDAEACVMGDARYGDAALSFSTIDVAGNLSLNYRPQGSLDREVRRPPSPLRVTGPLIGVDAGQFQACLNDRLPAVPQLAKPAGWTTPASPPNNNEFSSWSIFKTARRANQTTA